LREHGKLVVPHSAVGNASMDQDNRVTLACYLGLDLRFGHFSIK
jgi:hypothetical protein